MSFQVLVKTTAVMQGAYTFLLPTAEERAAFVQRPDIWWYHYPEEDDDWQWHRGGAWKPAHELSREDLLARERAPEVTAPLMNQAVTAEWQDEEDDDRW